MTPDVRAIARGRRPWLFALLLAMTLGSTQAHAQAAAVRMGAGNGPDWHCSARSGAYEIRRADVGDTARLQGTISDLKAFVSFSWIPLYTILFRTEAGDFLGGLRIEPQGVEARKFHAYLLDAKGKQTPVTSMMRDKPIRFDVAMTADGKMTAAVNGKTGTIETPAKPARFAFMACASGGARFGALSAPIVTP
jgi:hypothetical protein